MPLKKKSRAPRRRLARRPRRRGGVARKSKTNVSEFASLSVTRSLVNADANTPYSYDNFQLADFDRAVAVAKQYQHYRMTGVTIILRPKFDTYAPGAAQAKPNFYYMIDKAGSIPDNFTLEGLKQMGAKPRAFDEKPISISFRPAVLTEDLALGGAIPSQYKVSPWLSTNRGATNPGAWVPSNIVHQGVKWFMEQVGGTAGSIQVEVQIQFQFKKALMPLLTSVTAKGLEYAVINDSADGIVGGADGV